MNVIIVKRHFERVAELMKKADDRYMSIIIINQECGHEGKQGNG
ncbi:hypothetical protein ACG873_25400 [Mesorhizobium sp. AaZ16]